MKNAKHCRVLNRLRYYLWRLYEHLHMSDEKPTLSSWYRDIIQRNFFFYLLFFINMWSSKEYREMCRGNGFRVACTAVTEAVSGSHLRVADVRMIDDTWLSSLFLSQVGSFSNTYHFSTIFKFIFIHTEWLNEIMYTFYKNIYYIFFYIFFYRIKKN